MGTIKIYGKMVSGGVTSWYEITGAPTTLSGYGITDAASSSLTTFVSDNSASWGAGGGGGVSITTVGEVSAATLASANSYTDTAVSNKANTSHTHNVTAITNAASVSLVAAASAATVTYADSNFVRVVGGAVFGNLLITGNLSATGATTYIETNVAVASAMYIDTTSSETALRVTQKGSGDVIRVEDAANPDSTPFIVNADGLVGMGTAAPNEKLTVVGNISATGSYYGDGSNLTGIANTGNAGVNTWVQSNSANPTFTAVTADVYKVTTSVVNAQVGTTYTVAAGDNGKVITLDNASAITVGVPSGLGAGFSCSLIQLGAGQVSLSAGAGVTLNSYLGYTKIAGQHGGASLLAYSANTFNLNGALSA